MACVLQRRNLGQNLIILLGVASLVESAAGTRGLGVVVGEVAAEEVGRDVLVRPLG